MSERSELERLATSCIFPGFEGPTLPDWVRRRLADGLAGVVLYAWNVESAGQLASLIRALRAEREDVLVAIDEEGGDVTRLEATAGSSYPGNAALGQVDDVDLTESVAASMGADLASVGVNLDLAPVADVNTNPSNPVIGVRSFGSDAELVGRHVAAFVRGLRRAGVAAAAKHFPGHGDTSEDSHLALPVVDELEGDALVPFRSAIDEGVAAIMTAHIVVRSLGDVPATLSRVVLHDLLRKELGFDGLVVTDALEMQAVSATVGVEEGAVQALAAGADALCLGHDLFDEPVGNVRDAVVEAVRSGRLAEERLLEASTRVRALAEWASTSRDDMQGDAGVGMAAARRALQCAGRITPNGPTVVIELESEPGMAAGRLAQSPGEWFVEAVPGATLRRLREATALDLPTDGTLVVIVRDAHRHAWQREAVERALEVRPETVVVEVGLPHWRPQRGSYVATYGAGRVNVQAAAECLYSDSRRGVEQSGSSPGS